MTFRTRLRLAFLAVVLIPLLAFAFFVRKTMGERLAAEYQRRVDALVTIIEDDLRFESREIGRKLAVVARSAAEDNRFRLAAATGLESERPYLLDFAGNAMRMAGLSVLQIQDERGRIVSSGHFRNEYDRLEPLLPALLVASPGGTALIQARSPATPFLALARVDSFRVGGRRFSMVGGEPVGRDFLARLARQSGLTISLAYPGGVISSRAHGADEPLEAGLEASDSLPAAGLAGDRVVGELVVPYVDAERGATVEARIVVTHSLDDLRALRREIDNWFLVAVTVTVLVAYLLASWLASRISRPLVELARKTSRIDLERLDIDFASPRKDEVGTLSRLLGAMTERLRAGASRLKEAERRATIGELARQVNHDIKNGLTPIRNVFRHLTQVAREEPESLPRILDERQETLESSIAYLETLASNYARLYPRMVRQPCDVNAIVQQAVANASAAVAADLRLELCESPAMVAGDPVALRRIVENLVDNAIDSLADESGVVTVSTEVSSTDSGRPTVRIIVADTGCGMSEEQRRNAFDDFYTTKEDGTGLGLSIVRRLVLDMNGTVQVESEVGRGSRFTVELPLDEMSLPDSAAGEGEEKE